MTMDRKIGTALGETMPGFEQREISASIPERFARVVAACPEGMAVKSGDRSLTYAQLGDATDRASSALRRRLGEKSEAVALLFSENVSTVVALMGVLKAGKYYNALNPDDPPERGTKILSSLGARLLITDQEFLAQARRMAPQGCRVVKLDELLETPAPTPALPSPPLDSSSRAAVYFTSGTTGEPKGIPRNHGMLLHRAWLDTQVFGVGPGDRLTMMRGFMFSGSAGDIFGCLLNGACLYIYNTRKLGISPLSGMLIREAITIFRPPIELLRYFLDSLEASAFFPSIRCIVMSGDVFYKKDLLRIGTHFPKDTTIIHQLAASETGILARLVIDAGTEIDGDIVPVGYPVPGKEILILDENGRKLAPGEAGEIAVGSRLIDPEGGNLPDFMEERFIPDPGDPSRRVYLTGDLGRMRPDGLLEVVGRKDLQIKIRGYRVNPPVVVAKLMDIEGVRRAVVAGRADPSGEKRLVAYLVASPQANLSAGDLRSALAQHLPDYMLPSAFVFVDRIPVTSNEKIDYRSLPEPDWSHPGVQTEAVAPRDEIERRLAGIWQEVLSVEKVGIRDDFFALGGHSLTAASLCLRIEKDFGRKLYPALLVENNTVERLARILKQRTLPPKVIIPIQTGGERPLLFLAPGNEGDTLYFRSLAAHLGAKQPVYGLQATDLVGVIPALANLETMAAYFIQEMRAVQARGPYYLGGHSFGGRLAFAIAQLLVQAGERVDLLVLMDTFAPGQRLRADLRARIRMHTDQLRARPIREWPAYLHQRWNNILLRLARISFLRPLVGRLGYGSLDAAARNKFSAQGYTYRPYPGKLTLFRVTERPDFVHTDVTAGWREYASEVEVRDVPGTHGTLLNEPNVQVLACELKACLEEARTGRPSRPCAPDPEAKK